MPVVTKSAKILATTGGVLLLAIGALEARAATGTGVDVSTLLSMPALRVTELAAETRLPKLAFANTKPAKSIVEDEIELAVGAMPLQDLIATGSMSVRQLIDATVGVAKQEKTAPSAPVVTVAKAKPAPKGDLTVRVVIPEEPGREARAEKLTTEKARIESGALKAKVKVAAKAREANQRNHEIVLDVEETAGGIKLSAESLSLGKLDAEATIRVKAKAGSVALFVRDQDIVQLDQGASKLKARKGGTTELYVVAAGKMYIVPIKVESGDSNWDLKVPDALVSLNGLFTEKASANYPTFDAPSTELAPRTPPAAAETAPSLQDSVADQARADLAHGDEQHFSAAPGELAYKAVTIQVVDERTSVDGVRVFPAGNVKVRLVGTEFQGHTDATGQLTIRDMPLDSRFLVAIDDETGAMRSTMAEINTDEASGQVMRVRGIRGFAFDAYSEAAGSVADMSLGSMCGNVYDLVGEGRSLTANVAIELDADAEGPFYFNNFGFLDRGMHATGLDGRFCFFNISPGPIAVTLYEAEAPVATVPLSIFAGRHVEEDLILGQEQHLVARLATLGTANEQLNGDPRLAQRLRTVDMIDLIPLGTTDPMMQLGSGQVATSNALMESHGRVFAFAQAAEFEPTVYAFAAGAEDAVTPLVPRGFVEDMAVFAQVSYDPALGVVVSDFNHPASAEGDTIAMHLVDSVGQDVGDGWYYSDSPNTKAIFFNVPAGTYTLLVETKDGYWLGAETVIVYNETVSYARLGGEIRYRP